MRKFLRPFLLILSLASFGASILALLNHWDYETTLIDISHEFQQKVTKQDIVSEIELAIQESRFDDASMYLDIANDNNYPVDYSYYQQQILKSDTPLNNLTVKITHFTNGFIRGKGQDLAGIAGSVSADFTVVGDVRDLYQQYRRYEKGEQVDDLIVVLSGAGVGLTALTIGSLGATAPAKAGTSLLKFAAKTRHISTRFQKQLLDLGRKVFDWPQFTRTIKQSKNLKNIRYGIKQAYHSEALKPLSRIAGQVNRIRHASSTMDAVHLLKYVDTTDDLAHLEKITVKYGVKTRGYLKFLGKGALRTVRVLRKSIGLFISLFSSLITAMISFYFISTGLKKQIVKMKIETRPITSHPISNT